MKRILITGGVGYIGSTLIRALPEEMEIVVIDNFHIDTEYKRKNAKVLQKSQNVTLIEANVSETEKYTHAVQGTDVVIYMASLNSYREANADPLLYLRENVMNLQVFLNAVSKSGVKKFILTSSRGVYGEGPYLCHACSIRTYPSLSEKLSCTVCESSDIVAQKITEEDQTNPSSYYGLSKKFQEDILRLYCGQQNISLDILRIFNVYGENQGSYYSNIGIIPQILAQINQKKEMYLHGNGLLARDFVYVGDVVKVIIASIFESKKRKKSAQVYNIGSGEPTSIKDIADFFENLGYTFTRNNLTPYNDIKYSVADNAKVIKTFKLQSFNDISDFLTKTYKHQNK